MNHFSDYEIIDVGPRPACPRCQQNERGDVLNDGFNHWCAVCEQWYRVCEKCNKAYTAPMSPLCRDNHESTLPYYVFTPYFDYGLGREITSFADRWRAMRQTGMQYRDLPSKGDLSARRDRIEEAKRAHH